MINDIRRNKRLPLLLEVRLESLSGNRTARTGDISLGGCYIESLSAVSSGERISFEIQLPSKDWIRLHGEVAYQFSHMGFGVRFTELAEAERNLLTELLDDSN